MSEWYGALSAAFCNFELVREQLCSSGWPVEREPAPANVPAPEKPEPLAPVSEATASARLDGRFAERLRSVARLNRPATVENAPPQQRCRTKPPHTSSNWILTRIEASRPARPSATIHDFAAEKAKRKPPASSGRAA